MFGYMPLTKASPSANNSSTSSSSSTASQTVPTLKDFGFPEKSEIEALIQNINEKYKIDLDMVADNYGLGKYMDPVTWNIMRFPSLLDGNRYDCRALIDHYEHSQGNTFSPPLRDTQYPKTEFNIRVQRDINTANDLIDKLTAILTSKKQPQNEEKQTPTKTL
jgi:hypothetical protein